MIALRFRSAKSAAPPKTDYRRSQPTQPISIISLLAALNPQVDLHPFIVLLQNAVVLAQRMSLPALGQQNAFHVGMSVELDAKQVVDFALQPVVGGPYRIGSGTAVSRVELVLARLWLLRSHVLRAP